MTMPVFSRPNLLDPSGFTGLNIFIKEANGSYKPWVSSGTDWVPAVSVSLTTSEVAAMKSAGTPLAAGTIVIDPTNSSVLGTVDGSGDLVAIGIGHPGPATDGLANPMKTTGDLIVGGADGAPERLAVPEKGTHTLQAVDGVVTWSPAP